MKRAVAFLVALCLASSACGFRLRGDVALPPAMQKTWIGYSGTDASLRRTIARALLLSGVDVARTEAEATALLRLDEATVQRRVLTKDMSGRPREYELAVVLRYDVVTPDGLALVPAGEVERRSNLVLDPNDPLANQGDIDRAIDSLTEDAAWQMLRRIAAAESQAGT